MNATHEETVMKFHNGQKITLSHEIYGTIHGTVHGAGIEGSLPYVPLGVGHIKLGKRMGGWVVEIRSHDDA